MVIWLRGRVVAASALIGALGLSACSAIWGFEDLTLGAADIDADVDGSIFELPDAASSEGATSDVADDACKSAAGCSLPPSCVARLLCNGESCCTSFTVPAGSFAMGRSASGTDAFDGGHVNEGPEHTATVSEFRLDEYEVTVGRFREFVAHYSGPPAPGAGAHPKIADSGWRAEWNAKMPANADDLLAGVKCEWTTWTDVAGAKETLPINCVTYYESFAFCAWDGGRLPTEAEWEYAAAGTENRLYPWGSAAPDGTRASYYSGGGTISPVGSHTSGRGPFGHLDLAGNVWERVLDYGVYDDTAESFYGTACTDCANLVEAPLRMMRGGAHNTTGEDLRAARRFALDTGGLPWIGVRCARQ